MAGAEGIDRRTGVNRVKKYLAGDVTEKMKGDRRMKEKDLEPLAYTVSDIITLLQISRAAAYGLVAKAYQTGLPFRVVKIGDTYRIPMQSFDDWLFGRSNNESNS